MYSLAIIPTLKFHQRYADLKRFIHLPHRLFVQMSNLVREPLLIDGANLFQQDHGIAVETVCLCVNLNMRGQLSLLDLGRNGSHNNGRTESVADIILDDQNRPNPALF